MSPERPAEPWLSFLTELDAILPVPVDLHCIGGFVVSQCYGLGRETADLDVLSLVPSHLATRIADVAGRGSTLQAKHRVSIDHVGIANFPADYQRRLIRAFPLWPKLRLWALEAHDLALSKLERSSDRDIRDVMFLASAGWIERETLLSRFAAEYEPYVTGRTPTWLRSTLRMWVEACWPV